jgi:hypothetical protein
MIEVAGFFFILKQNPAVLFETLRGSHYRSLDAILDVRVKTSGSKDGTVCMQVFCKRLIRDKSTAVYLFQVHFGTMNQT